MKRGLTRFGVLVALTASITAAVFVQAASANYLGVVDITCTQVTYNFSTFPTGTQDVLETVFVDGNVVATATVTFVGPSASNTLAFSVPNDGKAHTIEANAYSLTNSTPVFGLPGVVSLTCGTPPPPPPSVCTFTKGYYRNHPEVTAALIAGLGGTIKVGSAKLTAAQAQAVLNATPGTPLNVTFGGYNLLLNFVQQLITAELNGARGSSSAPVNTAIAAANAGLFVTFANGQIQLATTLGDVSGLNAVIETFNSTYDCG